MTKELTLHLNEETVQRAERISKSQGKSINVLIEELLNSIPEKDEIQETAVDKIKKIMAPYITKLEFPENKSYKEMISQWRYEDYMKESCAPINEKSKK